MDVLQRTYDEVVDLFARTSSAEVLAFRPSLESQERRQYLLARTETDELTDDEVSELHQFREFERLIQSIRALAQSR